mgnify:CR=1 FL=1
MNENNSLLGTPTEGMRWYVVHAYSGMEKAAERNIVERITRAGMQDKFGRILVPTASFSLAMCWWKW